MEIERKFPPNIYEIKAAFPITVDTVYAYGNILYAPNGKRVSEDLMVHEETHSRQQKIVGVEQWWTMYIENASFRLEMEIEAYRNQYKFISENFNRHQRRAELIRLANDLSSQLYGNVIDKRSAQEIIANYV